MGKSVLLLASLFTVVSFGQFNKWSVEPEIGLTKIVDITQFEPIHYGLSVRYMPTTKFGILLKGKNTEIRPNAVPDVNYLSGQFFGVVNFGRVLDLENILNNRLTILGGLGGDYTRHKSTEYNGIFSRKDNFHLAFFSGLEAKITDKFFIYTGLNIVAGVNSRDFYPSTETTNIISFSTKAVIVIGRHKEHADFFLEPEKESIVQVIDKTVTNNPINNYYTTETSTKGPLVEYVYFEHDSYVIDKDGLANIEKAFDGLGDQVIVTGYCSNIGSVTYNQILGLKRADEVKNKLIGLGMDGDKILIRSEGIDMSRGRSVHDLARRVKIEVNME